MILCILQWFLSKAERKWFGLILPVLSFLRSVFIVFFLFEFERELNDINWSNTGRILLLFLLANVPTLIYWLIYHFTKKRIA
jgi:hypothetical protein